MRVRGRMQDTGNRGSARVHIDVSSVEFVTLCLSARAYTRTHTHLLLVLLIIDDTNHRLTAICGGLMTADQFTSESVCCIDRGFIEFWCRSILISSSANLWCYRPDHVARYMSVVIRQVVGAVDRPLG